MIYSEDTKLDGVISQRTTSRVRERNKLEDMVINVKAVK
jgi:hypothetical protein